MKGHGISILAALLASFGAVGDEAQPINVVSEAGSLTVSLVGGQVMSWRPAALGGEEVFFQSSISKWGEEFHGGVPICWPWFSRREGAPWHGVVRYIPWHAVPTPDGVDGDTLVLETAANDWTRSFWPHDFAMRAVYSMPSPDALEIAVTETNTGAEPFESVFGFHPYFALEDSGRCVLDGRPAPPPDGETTIWEADGAAHTLGDSIRGRECSVEASFADNWYFWNCGPKSKRLGPGEWRSFYCLEPLRRAPAPLEPGKSRTHVIRITARGTAAAATPALPPPDWRERMWSGTVALRPGVTLRAYALDEPRVMKVFVARIDLATPGIGWTATERAANWGDSMNDPDKPERTIETKSESTLDFMARRRVEGMNVELAFNTSPWTPFPVPKGIEHFNMWGWCVSDGVEVSPPKSHERLFIIRNDGSADILGGPDIPAAATNGVAFAASGYNILIADGEDIFEGERGGLHQRTALGLTPDKRTLVVLAVDGRQPGYSEGADMADLRRLLHREGVSDAVNMDGGGSTALVVLDPVAGEPVMVNRHKDGAVRKVAFNMGITFPND